MLKKIVRDANNGTSSAEYDTLGNITKLAGPMGSTVNYTYDEMGRLISESTSSGGIITYGYNALNIKEQLTNARGQKRKYFYDAMGRITGYVGEEDSVSYTYEDETSYWLKTRRKMKRFRDVKSLCKILPDKKPMIESYMEEHRTNFSTPEEVLELLKCCM